MIDKTCIVVKDKTSTVRFGDLIRGTIFRSVETCLTAVWIKTDKVGRAIDLKDGLKGQFSPDAPVIAYKVLTLELD